MEMDVEFQTCSRRCCPTQRETRRLSVATRARCSSRRRPRKLIDKDKIHATAIERVEQSGIVFLDEIDKVAGRESKHGPDVSRQGVQRDLLPIVEGSHGDDEVRPGEDRPHPLHRRRRVSSSKPSDLMPELQGRFPDPRGAGRPDEGRFRPHPARAAELADETDERAAGDRRLDVDFADDAIAAIAKFAFDVNRKGLNIGARRLYTIMEKVLESISFDAPDLAERRITITADYVRERWPRRRRMRAGVDISFEQMRKT
jgi:ATP-dependent HslUV protease ATP-binding subunit HslU